MLDHPNPIIGDPIVEDEFLSNNSSLDESNWNSDNTPESSRKDGDVHHETNSND